MVFIDDGIVCSLARRHHISIYRTTAERNAVREINIWRYYTAHNEFLRRALSYTATMMLLKVHEHLQLRKKLWNIDLSSNDTA